MQSPLVLDFSAVEIKNGQFVRFCADNGDLNFELTAKKELLVISLLIHGLFDGKVRFISKWNLRLENTELV